MLDLNKVRKKETLSQVAFRFCDYITENSLFEIIIKDDDFIYVTLVNNADNPSELYATIVFSPAVHLAANLAIKPYQHYRGWSTDKAAADFLGRQFIREEILGLVR